MTLAKKCLCNEVAREAFSDSDRSDWVLILKTVQEWSTQIWEKNICVCEFCCTREDSVHELQQLTEWSLWSKVHSWSSASQILLTWYDARC